MIRLRVFIGCCRQSQFAFDEMRRPLPAFGVPTQFAAECIGGKGSNSAFMAHYHALWAVTLDELLEAYVHGIVINYCFGLSYHCIRLWYRDRSVCRVFQKLLKTILHLEEPLMECSNKEAMIDLVCCIHTSPHHGVHQFGHRFRTVLSARSDDTKSLKGVGLDWISSRDISLNPPVALVRNVNRRRHDQSMLASMTVQVPLLSRPR